MKIGSKGIFSLGMMVLIGLMLLPGSAWARFAGGLGTAEDPWQIATPAQLDHVRDYLGSANADKHFVLIADLDLNVAPYNTGDGWEPIGNSVWNNDFRGHLDGRGHTISNLFIDRPSTNYVGLLGVTKGAKIENLLLADADITGDDYVGALAGQIEDDNSTHTVISNISVSGRVAGSFDRIGGLVGKNYYSTIRDSRAAVTVTGRDYVGGLAGELDSGRVEHSSATGDVSGEQNIGGLVGYSRDNSSVITDSFATGVVHGTNDRVGGLVGYQQDQEGTVANSYATGAVTGEGNHVGGLVGYNNGKVFGSYAIGPVAGVNDVGGLVGRNESAGEIANSYATGSYSGQDNVGGLVGNNSGTITHSYAIGPIFSDATITAAWSAPWARGLRESGRGAVAGTAVR